MKPSILIGGFVLAVAPSSPAAGQHPIEAGVARDARFGNPIECLHVSVLDSARKTIAHAVTDSAGQFQIEVPGPGAYRVQFQTFGWVPLLGPADTLAEGDFRQRVYPLAFRDLLVPDTASADTASGSSPRQRSADARMKFYLGLMAQEMETGWRSASMVHEGFILPYPTNHYVRRDTGSVLATFVVDSTGRVRANSWRTRFATHPDFEKALRGAILKSHWNAAQMRDQRVCAAVYQHVEFGFEGRVGVITLSD